jgi:hypothetical protein
MANFKQTSLVTNASLLAVTVWFEPWGMNHTLPANKAFDLVVESDIEGEIEIEHADDRIAVYSFPTSTIKIYLDGDLIDDLNVKFPASAVPKNTTTKQLVNFLFGGPGQPRSPDSQ